jgi:hypothetical protein
VAAEVRAAMPANGLNCHCSECLLDMLNRALGGRAPS